MLKKLLVPILSFFKNDRKIEDPRFANREAKQIGTKLLNWEAPRGAHKPSAEEIFQREQKTASENVREEEARRKANIEEDKWQEIPIPDPTKSEEESSS